MEVQHELHPGSLDALSQYFDSIQVLDDTLSLIGCRSIGRIDKQAHACSVPALLFGPSDDIINDRTILVIVMCPSDAIT